MTEKLYAERDAMEMDIAGNYYCQHVSAMTREGLHSKADIAAELGWRDLQIATLRDEKDALQAEYDSQLCALLPDARYMDPPDGGSVTPVDQVARMVAHLQEQVKALTAENVKLVNYVNDECYVENPRTGVYKCAGNDKPTTPATDAAICEINAQCVKDLHAAIVKWALHTWQYSDFAALKRAAKRTGDCEFSGVLFTLDRIENFAAQLRAKPEGEQP